MSETWRSKGFEHLRIRLLEDEAFIFNPASGETHLLNQEGLLLLRELHHRPRSTEQLLHDFGDIARQHQAELFEQLHQFELIGLLCRER